MAKAGKKWSLTVIFLLLLVALSGSETSSVKEPAKLPILDYLSISSYGSLLPIDPTGYFEVAIRYVHSPRVEWKPVEKAARYELLLVQDDRVLGTTEAISSPKFIEHGWDQIKVGKAAIIIQAFDTADKKIALSRMFPFYVAPDFSEVKSSTMKRPYKDAALKTFNALYDYKAPNGLGNGPASRIHPVLLGCSVGTNSLHPFAFPNLHDWMHVEMLVQLNKIADKPLKAKIIEYAKSVGDHLLMCRLPEEGNAYGGMICGCANINGEPTLGMAIADPVLKEKSLRLIEPGKCGYSANALIRISELTGDKKYLEAALKMAEVFVKTQRDDGSWYARVDGKSGEVIANYSTSVIAVVAFLDRLNADHPDLRWVQARDRAFDWIMKNPVKTYGWAVNFDDGLTSASAVNPYAALSNWDLFEFIRYLGAHPEKAPNAAEIVKEQLDWCDNHFVFYGSDPLLTFEPYYPCCAEQGNPRSFSHSTDCWVPMDFHTANWGSALLAAYHLTKDKRYLERARAAANTLTHYQLDNGWTMTWMCDRALGLSPQYCGTFGTHSFWPAGWAASAALWAELDAMEQNR